MVSAKRKKKGDADGPKKKKGDVDGSKKVDDGSVQPPKPRKAPHSMTLITGDEERNIFNTLSSHQRNNDTSLDSTALRFLRKLSVREAVRRSGGMPFNLDARVREAMESITPFNQLIGYKLKGSVQLVSTERDGALEETLQHTPPPEDILPSPTTAPEGSEIEGAMETEQQSPSPKDPSPSPTSAPTNCEIKEIKAGFGSTGGYFRILDRFQTGSRDSVNLAWDTTEASTAAAIVQRRMRGYQCRSNDGKGTSTNNGKDLGAPPPLTLREMLGGERRPIPNSPASTMMPEEKLIDGRRGEVSPHTGKPLPAYIFRDGSTRPPRALLFHELRAAVAVKNLALSGNSGGGGNRGGGGNSGGCGGGGGRSRKDSSKEIVKVTETGAGLMGGDGVGGGGRCSGDRDCDNEECWHSIDYCYLQPQDLPQVNRLLCDLFWPGIDMSDCLRTPDYSVVALYRRLLLGCAFLTPDGEHMGGAYIAYIAVRPDWQALGIGKFLLYHLIQKCPTKDVTLHVSANNPAMLLYQRFAFKPEEFVLDFYARYLPPGSDSCKNAFLMRLRR